MSAPCVYTHTHSLTHTRTQCCSSNNWQIRSFVAGCFEYLCSLSMFDWWNINKINRNDMKIYEDPNNELYWYIYCFVVFHALFFTLFSLKFKCITSIIHLAAKVFRHFVNRRDEEKVTLRMIQPSWGCTSIQSNPCGTACVSPYRL